MSDSFLVCSQDKKVFSQRAKQGPLVGSVPVLSSTPPSLGAVKAPSKFPTATGKAEEATVSDHGAFLYLKKGLDMRGSWAEGATELPGRDALRLP